MEVLSAAVIRDEVRRLFQAAALSGFVRIAPAGEALLVSDVIRRASPAHRADCEALLQDRGFTWQERAGLLYFSPAAGQLQKLAGKLDVSAFERRMREKAVPCEADALAERLLRCPPQTAWSLEGTQLLLEALRLPAPTAKGWPETDMLRPGLALMLRRHDRSAMHETGRVLAVRLVHETA